jgi:D-glycero-alpha-D-manno-heptose 1-phosphate guanylyltransferase
VTQAVILAGGAGTRLRAVTGDLPKPLAPACGRPFLCWLLELLARRGFRRALILTGYRGEMIEDQVGRLSIPDMTVRCTQEPSPLGTGGAVRRALDLLDPRFALLNGDTWLDIDYPALLRASDPSAPVTLAVVRDPDGATDVPGNVDVADGLVSLYRKGGGLPYIDAGAGMWSRDAIEQELPADEPCALEDAVARMAQAGRVRAWLAPGRFFDIGTPERLARFEDRLREEGLA